MSTPDVECPRYVVLVWMYDHWGVTYETDDVAEADRVTKTASDKVFALKLDTQARPLDLDSGQAEVVVAALYEFRNKKEKSLNHLRQRFGDQVNPEQAEAMQTDIDVVDGVLAALGGSDAN